MVQAVILAAGKSTRTLPLTATRPKPLLKVAGKTLIEHLFSQLSGVVDSVVLVVGYKKEMIKELLGDSFEDISITYVEQEDQKGTGHALQQAEKEIEDSFLLLNADDYYSQTDLKKLLQHDAAILVQEVDNPRLFGIVTHVDGVATSFEEKPQEPMSNLANTGAYYLPKSVLSYSMEKTSRGEIEIVDAVKKFMKEEQLFVENAEHWVPCTYPWSLFAIQAQIFSTHSFDNHGTIEEGVHIEGSVSLGEGTIIKSGTRIEGTLVVGDDSVIGPNAFLRGEISLGDRCMVGNAVEIKHCIIGDNSKISHLSYVGDSLIGNGCNWSAGCHVANLRHDSSSVKSEVNGKLIDTGLEKFGTVLGDGVKLGIGTLIYPGRKLWPNVFTIPGEMIKEDKKE